MPMNLNDFIMVNEVPIRLGFFFGIFAVMAAWNEQGDGFPGRQ
jgi:hypothetical protein